MEVLDRFGARWPLGLASSSNRVVIDRVLVIAGWQGVFEVTVSSEEVHRGNQRLTSTWRPPGGWGGHRCAAWRSRTQPTASRPGLPLACRSWRCQIGASRPSACRAGHGHPCRRQSRRPRGCDAGGPRPRIRIAARAAPRRSGGRILPRCPTRIRTGPDHPTDPWSVAARFRPSTGREQVAGRPLVPAIGVKGSIGTKTPGGLGGAASGRKEGSGGSNATDLGITLVLTIQAVRPQEGAKQCSRRTLSRPVPLCFIAVGRRSGR